MVELLPLNGWCLGAVSPASSAEGKTDIASRTGHRFTSDVSKLTSDAARAREERAPAGRTFRSEMRIVARAVARFWRKAYEDNLTGMAAMVAYNLVLSVFPLALIALFIAGRVLSSPDLSASVLADLESLFPSAT